MEAEEIVTASNIVYDQLDVRLEETVTENKKLEERLRQSDKEIERVKEQSLKWCSDYIEKDHAMQAQADDYAGVVNALCDKVKDSQEEIARLDAVVVMRRPKLESFDDTCQAI
jgi:predicted RNase H-like nuclease (RuvC/YqgF family)